MSWGELEGESPGRFEARKGYSLTFFILRSREAWESVSE